MRDEWSKISENLKNLLESGVFKVWIAPLKAHVFDGGLELTVPNAFVANWLESKMLPTLRQAAAPVLGLEASAVEVRVTIVPEAGAEEVGRDMGLQARGRSSTASGCGRKWLQASLPFTSARQPFTASWRYSFTDLVVGPTNNMAVAAARDVADDHGCVRTLFINSGSGLGKTHIAQAVGKSIAEERKDVRVAYLTAEDFASRFVAALRSRDVEGFKERFRDLDVLLLEDVHFFQGKEKMQEMALAVIKSVQNRGGKVIFTSSFSPRELQHVDSGLVSHFCSGILTDIGRPTEAMRRDILTRKAKSFQVLLPDNVCELLANHLDGDVRQLESCLDSLVFKARLLHCAPNMELAREILGQYAQVIFRPDLATIVRLVCESYGLDERQLRSRSRRKECVLGRNTVYYLARKHTELTLEEIGAHFNRRHTSVIKGITSVERELSRESTLGHQIARAVSLIERNSGVCA
ncbi:MAG: ATP-binding protein [Desulfovibrio sp.]|nr:ATP-binding protein [Desulfovibrio sp.]